MRFVAVIVVLLAALPAGAQSLIDMIPGKTLVDRAIEARSAGDIATDNRIVGNWIGYTGSGFRPNSTGQYGIVINTGANGNRIGTPELKTMSAASGST